MAVLSCLREPGYLHAVLDRDDLTALALAARLARFHAGRLCWCSRRCSRLQLGQSGRESTVLSYASARVVRSLRAKKSCWDWQLLSAQRILRYCSGKRRMTLKPADLVLSWGVGGAGNKLVSARASPEGRWDRVSRVGRLPALSSDAADKVAVKCCYQAAPGRSVASMRVLLWIHGALAHWHRSWPGWLSFRNMYVVLVHLSALWHAYSSCSIFGFGGRQLRQVSWILGQMQVQR